jgi:RHS repeat-associated protein
MAKTIYKIMRNVSTFKPCPRIGRALRSPGLATFAVFALSVLALQTQTQGLEITNTVSAWICGSGANVEVSVLGKKATLGSFNCNGDGDDIIIDIVPEQEYLVKYKAATNVLDIVELFVRASSCYDVYIEGTKTNDYHTSPPRWYTTGLKSEYTLAFKLIPKQILFTYDTARCGLTADGQSKARPTSTVETNSVHDLTWIIMPPALGCTINTNTGEVTAGHLAGTITVNASDVSGTCFEEQIQLNKPASGCQDCNYAFGSGSPTNASVELKIPLGTSGVAPSAGYLLIDETNSFTATPARLRYDFIIGDVDVIGTNTVRQIRSLEGLANVVANNDHNFEIELFDDAAVGIFTNGLYTFSGSPYNKFTVENPLGASDTNNIRITESLTGNVINYSNIVTGWEMVSGGALRKETKTESSSGGVRTVTKTVQEGTNSAVYKEITQYTTISTNIGERITKEIFGDSSDTLTNSYAYTNGYLQQVIRGDGSWEYYVYDTNNRPVEIYSSYLNQTVTNATNLCRYKLLSYDTNTISGSLDTGKLQEAEPRRIVEGLKGVETGRTYQVFTNDIKKVIRAAPGAAWSNANNLVTITKYYTNGVHHHEPESILYPDGTKQFFQYQGGSIGGDGHPTYTTNIVLRGVPDGTGTTIDRGTKSVTILGRYKELLSEEVYDVSAITNLILVSARYYTNDFLNRPIGIGFLDGSSITNAYTCCGLSETMDRDGTKTYFTYDALKRLQTITRNGIIVSNSYDAAGNLLIRRRFGTDGSTNILEQYKYDLANRILRSTNALFGETAYSRTFDASGETILSVTNDDGGIRIERRYRDGSIKSITGTAAQPVQYLNDIADDGTGSSRAFSLETRLVGSSTNQWTKSFRDFAGRPYKTMFAASGTNYPYSQLFYNVAGQLEKSRDPDGVTNLFVYNNLGELSYAVADTNRNGIVDWNGPDRIVQTTNDVYFNSSYANHFVRTRTYQFFASTNTPTLVSSREISTNGLISLSSIYPDGMNPVTSVSKVVFAGGGTRYVTNIAPDLSYVLKTYTNGLLASTKSYDSNNILVTQISYGYDAHGRPGTVTDLRNGTTTFTFNNADQITSTLTPAPGTLEAAQTTLTAYDRMGRATNSILADGGSVSREYYVTGLLKKTSGTRTYPVQYVYDDQQRQTLMFTWTNYPSSGAALTSWSYNQYRGWLDYKHYTDSTGPSYAYTDAGRLATRTWARGVTTTFSYDNNGDPKTIDYSDSTPDVTFAYDRAGRTTSVTDIGSRLYTYNNVGQVQNDIYSALGTSTALEYGYDAYLRRSTLTNTTASSKYFYGYDAAGRLANLNDQSNFILYTYTANSPLLSSVAFKQNTTLRLATAYYYDYLNRLRSVSSVPKGTGEQPLTYSYDYNSANQRERLLLADSSRWQYQYDSLGQVTSGKRYWSDSVPVAGEQFEYLYDTIGNRRLAKMGGDALGGSLRTDNYTVNTLNQVTGHDVPGTVDIIGAATATNTVTVNGNPAYRHGEFYQYPLPIANASAPIWQSVTVAVSDAGLSTNGNILFPAAGQTFSYDSDGNRTGDGVWNYIWDGENRLVQISNTTSVATAARKKLDFSYDHLGRRYRKIASTWNGSAWVPGQTNYFFHDGWLLAAETSPGITSKTFLWGLDLSGSPSWTGEAGGVSGMAAMKYGTDSYYPAYDGNGDVIALVGSADGKIKAQYEYGPFGEPIRVTGGISEINPLRFSNKYTDDETGLTYYGHRYYNASLGRWLNRDPLGEAGGLNAHRFVENNPLSRIDPDGLQTFLEIEPEPRVQPGFRGLSYGRSFNHVNEPSFEEIKEAIREEQFLDPLARVERNAMQEEYWREKLLGRRVRSGELFFEEARSEPSQNPRLFTQVQSFSCTAPATFRPAHPSFTGAARPMSSLLQRYLNGSGGRWGGAKTRAQNDQIATDFENEGNQVVGGAGRAQEEWFPGPGGGTKGGTFIDITVRTTDNRTIRVQTVSTLSDGKTPTPYEAAAISRIKAQFPMDQLIVIPKR